ncbi:hypothetical protein [Breznakiella homolactica]|uniref:Uncharacterized protein n=1 Tax=Breznakiella homolactica TaxID=2798577 RepID=A0A7T7XR10_9SPIR|nr:hypothetical protein [Breznakiella homolactica]QQO10869.1 hypothetical protein JFL75_08120 [Breznakiella homolactica]
MNILDIIGLITVILLVIVDIMETIGQHTFAVFFYKMSIPVYFERIKSCTGMLFDTLNEEIEYKDIVINIHKNNEYFLRLKTELKLHPKQIFPLCIYSVKVKNGKYILKLRVPLTYLCLTAFIVILFIQENVLSYGIIFFLIMLLFLGLKMFARVKESFKELITEKEKEL